MSLGDLYQLYRRNDTPLISTLELEATYSTEMLARINETIQPVTSEGRDVYGIVLKCVFILVFEETAGKHLVPLILRYGWVVRGWLVTAEAWFRSQGGPCGICGEESD
jgi:hypothetical protein